VLEGATATGPGGMAVSATPVPEGNKGQYAFLFPVRPGETRFQIGYHLPYSGSLDLHARVSMPTDNVAIMLPKAMHLTGAGFQPLPADANEPGVNTFLATNATPGKSVDFTVSGTGSMPREAQGQPQGQPGQGGMGGAMPGADASAQGGTPDAGGQPDQSAANRPGGGLGNPIETPDPLNKYKGWILSGLGLALVIAAAFMLRARPNPSSGQLPSAQVGPTTQSAMPAALTPTPAAAMRHTPTAAATNGAGQRSSLLAALKDELFSLETERLEGKLSEAQYAELKSAFEVVLRRALSREGAHTR
jgi:hypothetical protein